MKHLILIVVFFLINSAFANVEVKFVSYIKANGSERLSTFKDFPKEKRMHVAIKINGYWYEMIPKFGFYKSEMFQAGKMPRTRKGPDGKNYHLLVETLYNETLTLPDVNPEAYKYVKFDWYSRWDDPITSHCSKFVGQLLGLDPRKPQHTGAEGFFYPVSFSLSPDDIFDILSNDDDWVNLAQAQLSCQQVIKSGKKRRKRK